MSSSSSSHTIKECLEAIGVDNFEGCNNDVQAEFSRIKKQYFSAVLRCHPDKGGDAEEFRRVQSSFEVLREMHSKSLVQSFASELERHVDDAYSHVWNDFESVPVPSWDYFYTAAEEEVPTYKVELAKSGRSACSQKGAAKKCSENKGEKVLIEKGEIRVGWMNEDTGSYGGWAHLQCWRVPSKVWMGLPDPEACTDTGAFVAALEKMNLVLLTGFSELSPDKQQEFIAHLMSKENYARKTKPRKTKKEVSANADGEDESGEVAKTKTEEQQLVAHGPKRERFIIPQPGKDGALANALAGKTVVLTGTFPEVGGGAGLNLGKDRVKQMVKSFGGRVTSAISGKTDVLVVGKSPGFSKVSKARTKPKISLVNLKELTQVVRGAAIENVQPAVIADFSSGYKYGAPSLALKATAEELAIARGQVEPAILQNGTNRKRKKAPPKKTRSRKKPLLAIKETAEPMDITCDSCGSDCTNKSWFVVETEEDFCDDCHSKNPEKEAVMQVKGVTVATKKARSSRRKGSSGPNKAISGVE